MEVPVAFASMNERLRPVGDTTLAHATTHRFFLMTRSEKGVLRGTMTVLDSLTLPYGAMASYLITDKGVEDAL